MNKWQRILVDHDCDLNIINDNTVIVTNKLYIPSEKRFLNQRITKVENSYLIEDIDNGEVIESYHSSLRDYLGY